MKTLVIKSNHGNHSDFNRTWELLAVCDSVEEARAELIEWSIERTEGCDGWIIKNGRAYNVYSKEFLATNKSDSFEEDLYYFHIVPENKAATFFSGGHRGFTPEFVKKEFPDQFKDEKTTLYRADDYEGNMGDLIGFFKTHEEAEDEIEYKKEVNSTEGNFSQITELEVPSSYLIDVDIRDSYEMLPIWGDGEIVNNYYYV